MKTVSSLTLVVGALLVVAPALADEASDTATARTLGIEGVTLANSGNCKAAVEKLERAEKLHHAPTTATRLGECEVELGKLVRGTERLQRVIREPLAPNAHAAFGAAVSRAHKVLESTLPRLATLRIGVDAPPGTRLTMTIDDEPTSDAIVDTDRLTDPGAHTIKVTAEGFVPSATLVSIDEGQTKAVVVELRRDPNARAAAVAPSSSSPTVETSKRSAAPAIVAFGVSAIGLGIGIYGAVVVDQKASSLSNNCANHVCPPEQQRDLRDARTWATVSTAGFVTAGVGAAAGVVLLLVTGNAKPTRTGAQIRPSVGLSQVGVDGIF